MTWEASTASVSPLVANPSPVEEESIARLAVDTTDGGLLGAGSTVRTSIPVDSEEDDFFTSSVPEFVPTVEVETSLKEPVL